jgi:hypothetical protein
MSQAVAFGVIVGLIVVLFAGIYWLSDLNPSSDSPGDGGDPDHHHSSHSGGHSGDGPTIGPA